MATAPKLGGAPPGPHTKCVANGSSDPLDDFALRLIRRKAKQLSGRTGFSQSDRPDLEQELALVVLRRLPDFDPCRSHYNAFVTTVVERFVATILQHRSAEMRTYRRYGGSLNATVTDSDGRPVELVATMCSSQQSLRTGHAERPHEEASGLIRDVADLLDKLPPQLRELCKRLQEGSVSQVAREMGLSRKTLYRRRVNILRRFEQSGMREYL